MTLSANEIKYTPLLTILYKLQHNCSSVSKEEIDELTPMQRSELINEDPVTCAVYFNKLVNAIMSVLQQQKIRLLESIEL